MAIEKILTHVDEVEATVREGTNLIYHSTPLTSYPNTHQLDLRDLYIAGAISGRNILANGGTGTAKTHFGLLFLNSLFGSTPVLQIDPGLTEERLYDVLFKEFKEGKLSEAFQKSPLLTSPGVLCDEVNRAPQVILNILQAYLNNQVLTGAGGKQHPIGVKISEGSYQSKIGTCNEGKKYEEGTFRMDPAFRRRWAIEIPFNLFPPTQADIEEKNKSNRTEAGLYVPERKGITDTVLELHKELKDISIHPLAQEFLAYLGRMNNCIKSPFKTKDESGFTLERCDGCHARGISGEQNFCGNVYAPSGGTISDLATVARAFALIRQYHKAAESGSLPEKIEVALQDVEQAFPFVAATKLGLNPDWIRKNFKSGEPFEAARAVTVNLEQRLNSKLKNIGGLIIKPDPTEDEIAMIKTYTDEDAWAYGLRDSDFSPTRAFKRLKLK